MARVTLKALVWIAGLAAGAVVLGLALAFVILQTQVGHDFVLRMALARLPDHADGEVRIGSLRSDGLLRGFTLYDVSIRDERDRPFLDVDSVRVRYAYRELLRGEIALVPADAWGASVVVERLHGEAHTNVERIFRVHAPPEPSEQEGDSYFARAVRTLTDDPERDRSVSLRLERVALHDADLLVRLPEGDADVPEDGFPASPGELGDGEGYRTFEFSGIRARIAEASLLRPGQTGERVVFDELSLTARMTDEPVVVESFRGEVERGEGRIDARVGELVIPGARAVGALAVVWENPDEDPAVEAALDVDASDLAAFRWLEPRLPEGSATFSVAVEGPFSRSSWQVTSADVSAGASRLRGAVGFELGEPLRLTGADLQVAALDLEAVDPWLDEPLPVRGRVTGRVRASGTFAALDLDADLTYDDPAREIPASGARMAGRVGFGDGVSADGLLVDVDPLRYETLRAFAPELELVGQGRVELEVTGSLEAGADVAGWLTHVPPSGGEASVVRVSGWLGKREDVLELDLAGTLEPLSFDGLAVALGRELPVGGEVSGPVRVRGPLERLELDADLLTPAGRLAARGGLNALDPSAGYRFEGDVEEFALHRVLLSAPHPTLLTGSFEVDGRGATLDEIEGTGRVELSSARILDAHVDRLEAAVRADEGRLHVDELEVRSELGTLDGTGDLALREGEPEGEVSLEWEAASLDRLRPLLLGERVIAADTLTQLERDILRLEGVDPDTLPDVEAVAVAGNLRGGLTLRGALRDLDATGFAELTGAVYGEHRIESGVVEFTGGWRGGDDWNVAGSVELEEFAVAHLAFEGGTGEVAVRPGAGEADVHIRRRGEETHRLGGRFEFDDAGVDLFVETLSMDLAPAPWTLVEPAHLRIEERSIRVDLLRIARPALDQLEAVRLQVQGMLSLAGSSDFSVDVEGVDLIEVGRILQMGDLPEGRLALSLDVAGPPDDPEISGHILLRDFGTGGTSLSRVEGSVDYRDLAAETRLEADLNGRRLLSAEGRLPVDLSFEEVPDRLLDQDLRMALQLDSLPAASAFAFLGMLENVEGVLDGRLELTGRPRSLRPSGEIRLRDGAASLPDQGLRLSGVGGTFRVRDDRTVEVSGEAYARGRATIDGTISLDDPADPGFDLRIVASNFQAVERRDLSARIGGEIALLGQYTRPRVEGDVRVEGGTILLEEFARTAEVVDLNDPAFFDVVDTTLVAGAPPSVPAENPFLRNLRVDVDLGIQRDFWLRSREMNVEIDGDLIVTFDRPRRELLLVGNLEAVRGAYTAFGRQFEVQEGTVEFAGTPGINPALDIRAVNRVRREGGEPLDVVASLTGTLENMQVNLTSDAQPPIAESDLISYLIFGRPSYALASGERSVLEGAAQAGVGVGLGAIASQLGSVVAQQFGVDYFTITQARETAALPTSAAGLTGTLAQTQIEMGQYVGENLFLALTLRPLTGLGARTQTRFPGARLEWRFADLWTAEAFVEDRFAREASFGFGELGLRLDKVTGLSLYRDWGY